MLTITFDPNDVYGNDKHHHIAQHCNVILNWVMNPDYVRTSFKNAILGQYLYGSDFAMGGTIDHIGVYRYPEDPPMSPLLKVQRDEDILYFYQHDIIALKDKDQKSGFYITRVD